MYLLFLLFYIYFLAILYRNYCYDFNHNNHIRLSTISKRNKRNKVIYLINPTAGLGNTLRGMASTIFMCYIYSSSFVLKGWNSIINYFQFPKMLISNSSFNNTFIYIKFNKSLMKVLESKIYVIQITDIHGFIDYILYNQYNARSIQLIKKLYTIERINRRVINYIIYNEFFLPSNIINTYVSKFKLKKKKMKVLGIHIRSGKFFNNFTEKYFSGDIKLTSYFTKAIQIIKDNNMIYVFTISDNEKILNEMKLHFRKLLLEIPFKGNIIHSRFSLYNSKINNEAIRIVSEFVLLANCDYIIGTRRSSFSSESCNYKLKKCILV